MFWKLCKHELKCSYRSFLVLYAIVMVAALLMNPRNEGMITNIAAIVYIIMSVVMFIMCVVVIIKNYSNSMFSRNSYLTHTLPVTSTQLLLTKILSAVFWIIVSVFVLFLSMLIIGLRVSGFDFSAITETLQQFFSTVIAVDSLLYLFYMIVGTAESVALVYLVMNITHTTYVPRYRTAVAILLYILISWILSFVFDRILLAPFHLASDDFAGTIMGMFMGMQVEYQFMAGVGIMIVKSLLLLSLFFFFGSKYILDHKLEIE
ncbi:hypothetical protein C4181_13815 [Clostridioides difficile]|nr:hypothetical protein [Clostridioides difficile]